jgi:hypothetical protein
MHVPYKYSHPLQNQSNSQSEYLKVNLQELLSTGYSEDVEEISVKSFLPEELPGMEQHRRDLTRQLFEEEAPPYKCNQSAGNPLLNQIKANYECKQEPDRLDLISRFTEEDELPECHDNLILRKDV